MTRRLSLPYLVAMSDRSLCPICAWRGDCNKKFKAGAGVHCPDFSRDLTIKNPELEAEADRQADQKSCAKKPKKGLWPI